MTSSGAGELLETMEMPRSGDNPDLTWEPPAGAMTTIASAARGTVRAAARLKPDALGCLWQPICDTTYGGVVGGVHYFRASGMRSGFSSAKITSRRRWAVVVSVVAAVVSGACASACTNMTADAEPVLHASSIPGLSARADAGTEAYVCTLGYDSDPGATVTPVNLADGDADPGITTGTLPDAVAASPDGRLVLVTDEGEDELTVLDASDGDVIATIPTGVEPDAVAVSPDGTIAVVANGDDGTVTPVNLRTMRAEPPVGVGGQPAAVGIGGPDGRTALVANLGEGTVTPVDLETMKAGSPIRVGNEPDAIAVSPEGDSALVADLGSDSVTFVNLMTLTASPSVNVGVAPTGIAAATTGTAAGTGAGAGAGTGTVAWVSGGTSLVSVSFAASPAVGHEIPIGHLAEAVAIAHDGTTAWVADNDPYVTAVDLVNGRVLRSVRVGGRPSAIVIPPPIH